MLEYDKNQRHVIKMAGMNKLSFVLSFTSESFYFEVDFFFVKIV